MSRGAVMLAVTVAVAAAMAVGTVASAEVFKPGVWVNGRAFDLVTEPYSPGTAHDLYRIAPIDIGHPQVPRDVAAFHGYGIHDHVFALPLGRTTFSGVCNLLLLVSGPKAKAHMNVEVRQTATPLGKKPLLYQARLGNALVNLTSVARIQRAIRLGLARVIPAFTLGCTITPHRQ